LPYRVEELVVGDESRSVNVDDSIETAKRDIGERRGGESPGRVNNDGLTSKLSEVT
jgi:hypothetical protein